MKHTMLTFRLHLKGVVLVAFGALLAATLLLVGGCLLGQWRAGKAAAAPETAMAGAGAPASAGAGAAANEAGSGGGAPSGASAADLPPGLPARYTLRVGAFSTADEAKALADRLTARGYAATLGQVEASSGAVLHLVYVGSYGTLWEARGAAGELERREARDGLQATVVPAPQ